MKLKFHARWERGPEIEPPSLGARVPLGMKAKLAEIRMRSKDIWMDDVLRQGEAIDRNRLR